MLNLWQGEGTMDITKWPRAKDGRPIFIHIASLVFHYGPAIAVSSHSFVWFRDLGGSSISGRRTRRFRDLWVPQMVAFVSHQHRRRVGGDQESAPQALQEQVLKQRSCHLSTSLTGRII
jgi:hypothetical protein